MAVLAAAANLPITYMTAVDGRFHTRYGLTGMLLVDAGCSIVVGAILLLVLNRWWSTRSTRRQADAQDRSSVGT